MVYDAIRRINDEVGRFVSDQIENIEDGQVSAEGLAKEPKSRRS